MIALAPPRIRELFDLKSILAFGLIGIIGFQACDLVNRRFDQRFVPASRKPNPKEWVAGATVNVGITLVTTDADRLACASDKEWGPEGDPHKARCEFKQNKQRWPKVEGALVDDNGVDLLVPYRTTIGNHLVVVAGLWDTPALAFRRHREPSRAIQEAKLKRFTARCDLEFLGTYDALELRWGYTKPWYTEKNAPVARAKSCVIE